MKEKLARMAVEFRGAIQDARRIAGFEPPGTLEEIDTLLEKLIPELDGSLTPDTTKIAAGAGLDAARKGTRGRPKTRRCRTSRREIIGILQSTILYWENLVLHLFKVELICASGCSVISVVSKTFCLR